MKIHFTRFVGESTAHHSNWFGRIQQLMIRELGQTEGRLGRVAASDGFGNFGFPESGIRSKLVKARDSREYAWTFPIVTRDNSERHAFGVIIGERVSADFSTCGSQFLVQIVIGQSRHGVPRVVAVACRAAHKETENLRRRSNNMRSILKALVWMILLFVCSGWGFARAGSGETAPRVLTPQYAAHLPAPVPCDTTKGSCWKPTVGMEWQWQLSCDTPAPNLCDRFAESCRFPPGNCGGAREITGQDRGDKRHNYTVWNWDATWLPPPVPAKQPLNPANKETASNSGAFYLSGSENLGGESPTDCSRSPGSGKTSGSDGKTSSR